MSKSAYEFVASASYTRYRAIVFMFGIVWFTTAKSNVNETTWVNTSAFLLLRQHGDATICSCGERREKR